MQVSTRGSISVLCSNSGITKTIGRTTFLQNFDPTIHKYNYKPAIGEQGLTKPKKSIN